MSLGMLDEPAESSGGVPEQARTVMHERGHHWACATAATTTVPSTGAKGPAALRLVAWRAGFVRLAGGAARGWLRRAGGAARAAFRIVSPRRR